MKGSERRRNGKHMCQEKLEKIIDMEGKRVIREALEVWALAKANPPVYGFTLNEYQKLAARTINRENSPAEMEMHALHGMCGEIGELHSLYQKMYQGHQVDKEHAMKELGDLLFSVCNLARHLKVDSESALEGTTAKFSRRFRAVEAAAKAAGRNLKDMTLAEMDGLWDEAKKKI